MSRTTVVLALGLACASAVHAQTASETQELRELIEEQRRIAEQQQQIIDRQRADSDEQREEIHELKQQVEAISAGRASFGTEEAQRGVEESLTGPYATAGPPSDVQYTMSVGVHINRAVNTAYDGDTSKAYFVDNNNIPSFFFLKAAARVSDDLSVRAHFEPGFSENGSTSVNQKNESVGLTTSGRFFELVADSKKYGTLSFGKGAASSLVIIELDQSGTQYANLLSVGNTAGGLLFYDKRTRKLTDIQVNSAFFDLEALSLINRVRYDSPSWNGFRLSGTAQRGRGDGIQ